MLIFSGLAWLITDGGNERGGFGSKRYATA
jgi:hypothetical protein